MTDAKSCPTCGAPLPADATGGACPKCLLEAGFATGGAGAAPSAERVPSPEELAPKFPGLEIREFLGRGGMGVVYRARHKALDRDVALKILPADVASDRSFADRFQREARALAKLQHPNIVAVHDFGQSDGLFWLVMEFVDGANIRQAMRAGQVHPKEALAIVPQICDALQYAHEHGVVHRDIKPENVLLDKSGRVKVADFGLAKLMEHDAASATLTGAGQVMGTPHYMAPEQWERPKDVDHRADIYSLGVVFYEMLTGELPIGRFAAPSKKSDIDARIDEIVLRTLEKEREARYQRVEEVKTDVGRLSAAPVAPPPAEGPRHRVSWPLAAGGLLCMALVLVITARDVADVTKSIAAVLAVVVGAGTILYVASQRRRRPGGAPSRPHWGVWVAVAALILCGGPLAVLAMFVVSAPARNSGTPTPPITATPDPAWEASMEVRYPPGMTGRLPSFDLWAHNDYVSLRAAHPLSRAIDARRFYRPQDAAKIEAMSEDDLRRAREDRTIGLPLAELWATPLSRFTLKLIEVGASGTDASATVEIQGSSKIRFPIVLQDDRWYFALGPVEKL